jgi:hypothetical protein
MPDPQSSIIDTTQPLTPQEVADLLLDDEFAAEVSAIVAARRPLVPPEPKLIEPVPINLDGRIRHLRLGFKEMYRFHLQTGLSAWAREVWNDPSPDIMVALLWAGLLHEDPTLTVEQVENFPGLQMGNIAYITDRIGELWGKTMPDADTGEVGQGDGGNTTDPNPLGLQNGSTTGRSPVSISDSPMRNSGASVHGSTEPSSTDNDTPTS